MLPDVSIVGLVINENATGFVEINIAGKKYYVPVENGKAVFVNDFAAGTYSGNVKYLGDDNFNEAFTLVSFAVTEQNVTLDNTTIDLSVAVMITSFSIA